ncbi:hypothetical protein HG535_0H03960 [Zygotorulaspora mrakii]|uniref:RRM domain-containing protein n=1 Tax=Zygotorulaspora mrakii TaxID=42260 RepID=A0A7H9BAL2_ZYGMR|nr:uncharacterized protein HG535_0H03960 [Zygotorulaspora mrakii]QLG75069.1 hypothetical protein HG535_0H03960 [Zygotorulaspora mrakii]
MRSYNNNNINHFFQSDLHFQNQNQSQHQNQSQNQNQNQNLGHGQTESQTQNYAFGHHAIAPHQRTIDSYEERRQQRWLNNPSFLPNNSLTPQKYDQFNANDSLHHYEEGSRHFVHPSKTQHSSFGIPLEYAQRSSSQGSGLSSAYSPQNSYTPLNTISRNDHGFALAAAVANVNSSLSNQMSQINMPRDFTSAPSRTVYLGNIPPLLTVKELLDRVRSGVVEDVRILPDKMCAFLTFVDESSALLYHSDAILKRLNIDDRDIKIGWGKSSPQDPIVSAAITNYNATRNVYIGLINTRPDMPGQVGADANETVITEDKLRADLETFGEIDCIKIVKEKGIAFIHFTSILTAIKVVNTLAGINPYYQNKKIFYGKDRCAFITKTQQHNAAQFLGIQSGMEDLSEFNDHKLISNALLQQSAAAAAIATSAGGPNNLGNRTVYLGNLPKDVRIEEICNVVRGGILQSIKLLSDRHVCFITFIDPTAAAQFYAMSSLHGITIQKRRCRVGWGKHRGPLPNALALAVSNGAARNVYVGNIDFEADSRTSTPIFTEPNLRNIFQQYGEVEQINFLPERSCCFINFTNINNAILAIDKIKSNSTFKDLKINFGKDRCGAIPHQIR